MLARQGRVARDSTTTELPPRGQPKAQPSLWGPTGGILSRPLVATGVPSPAARLPHLFLTPHLLDALEHSVARRAADHLLPPLQGAAEHGLEKIPEPIKEATALFYGKEGLACLRHSDGRGGSRERRKEGLPREP